MRFTRGLWYFLSQNVSNRESWVRARLSEIPAGSKILDVGAGGQPYRKYCSHLEYRAQDFAQLDESNLSEGGYGKLDYISDICSIPEKDSYFDAVLCTEVLEHVPEPALALKEIGRLLKPGGGLILTAPLGSFLHQQPYHYYGGYTPFFYDKYLKNACFDSICVEQNGGFFRYYAQECQRVYIVLFSRRGFRSLWRWVLFPVEVFCACIFVVALPLICYFLDKFVKTPDITIGYHVLANKKAD